MHHSSCRLAQLQPSTRQPCAAGHFQLVAALLLTLYIDGLTSQGAAEAQWSHSVSAGWSVQGKGGEGAQGGRRRHRVSYHGAHHLGGGKQARLATFWLALDRAGFAPVALVEVCASPTSSEWVVVRILVVMPLTSIDCVEVAIYMATPMLHAALREPVRARAAVTRTCYMLRHSM